MAAPRKPDLGRQRDMEEARKLKAQKVATFDAKVRRAWEAGTIDEEIARELRVSGPAVTASRKRQGLPQNKSPVTGRPRYG